MFPSSPFPQPPPEEPPLTAEDIDPFLADSVLVWRAKELRRHGMIPPQARHLALDRSVDVHWVINRLLKRGCPPDTAFLIAS
jgi:hypothetical protein